MDEDRFNMAVRKFLKQVGVTSQREIENVVRSGQGRGRCFKSPDDADGRQRAIETCDRGDNRI